MSNFVGEEENCSGLVREVRLSTTSDQYDLSGYTEQRVRDFVKETFSKPFKYAKNMIKCTFVVGGGKLVRSKYPEDLPKWMTSALKDINFQEDKSAAETPDSQGKL